MSQVDAEYSNENLPVEKKGTHDDQRDMFRMGKRQELRVRTRRGDLARTTADFCSVIFVSSPSLDSP